MSKVQMHDRFTAYNDEIHAFIFGEWSTMSTMSTMSIPDRESRESEINAKHCYRHGWICVDGHSFNQHMAFPDREFVNVFD